MGEPAIPSVNIDTMLGVKQNPAEQQSYERISAETKWSGRTTRLDRMASQFYWSLVTRKPVFGVSDQVRLKPAYSATDTS